MTIFLLSMVLAVSAKPLSTEVEGVVNSESMTAVAGSDDDHVDGGFYWSKNYNVNGGWGFTIINSSSHDIRLVIKTNNTDTIVDEDIAVGATKNFGGTRYGLLQFQVDHTTATAILDFSYWISYY